MPQEDLDYAPSRGGNAVGVQPSSGLNYPPSQAPQQGVNASNAQDNTATGQNPPQRRKPRRPGQELALAARHRRLQTEYKNFHHPPTKNEIWICEFCEYEAIFGMEPRALVRSYEVKDRKKREDAEHRRQLLEKAKAKGRKNKKGNKGQGKNAGHNSTATDPAQQPYDPHYDNMASQDFESPGEGEYYDDGYDDPDPSAAYDYDDEEGWPQETPFAKDAWSQSVPGKHAVG